MSKLKKLSLNLNKEVITHLDKSEASEIRGGEFLSIWGSNCYNTNPAQHNCCSGASSMDAGACTSTGSTNYTAMAGTCCCGGACNPSTQLQ